MNIDSLITIALVEALEQLERDNIIKFDIDNINEEECSVCFDKHVRNNLKLLSCKKHLVCNECWENYVRSRVGIDPNSHVCFICFSREYILTSTTYQDNISDRLIDYRLLFDVKNLINSIYYYNQLYISIYQADFKYLETTDNDVIINLVNNKYLFHKYGLALTLYEKAKHTFGPECLEWVKNNGVLPKNSVAITNGGFIKGKIINCNSPNPAGKSITNLRYSLELCYINIFEKILTLNNIKKIYLPGILARRVEENDELSVKIAVKALYTILTIYVHDLRQKGIEEINIIDYGKNPKILNLLSNAMDNILFI